MKLVSRPENLIVGDGEYAVRLEFEQLQLIAALLSNVRLGDTVYQEAAYELMNVLEEVFDGDFINDSASDVDYMVSIEDDSGNIIEKHHFTNICIEV